jgi:DNA-binding HxlR family transcriptional regulator
VDRDAVTQDRIRCGVEATVAVISGKWKPLILHALFYEGTQRFNALLRKTGAPRQALTVQLRELERDGVLSRQVFAEVPPRVEYSLTPRGRELGPVLLGMLRWGERFEAERQQLPPSPEEQEA